MARCKCGRFATAGMEWDTPVVWCGNPSHSVDDMVMLKLGRDTWLWKMRVTVPLRIPLTSGTA